MYPKLIKLFILISILVPLRILLDYEKTFLLQEENSYSSQVSVYQDSVLYKSFNDIVQVRFETGQIERTFRGSTSEVFNFAVLNITLLVAGFEDATLVVWDLETASILKRYELNVNDFRYQKIVLFDNLILLGNFDGVVRKIDMETGQINDLAQSGTGTNCILKYQDFVYVCTNRFPYLIKVNPRTGEIATRVVRPTDVLLGAIVFEDSIIGAEKSARVYQWDIETGTIIREFNTGDQIASSLEVYEGYLYSVNEDLTVLRWSLDDGEPYLFGNLFAVANIWPPVIFNDFMLFGVKRGVIDGYHPISGELKAEFTVTKMLLRSIVIWREFVISAGLASRIYEWDKESFDIDPVHVVDTQSSEILCLCVYEDYIFSSAVNLKVYQWILPSLDMERVYEGQKGAVRSIVAANDYFYIAGDEDIVFRFNLTPEGLTYIFSGNLGFVNQLRLYGDLLLSAGDDQTVRSWNVTTLEDLSVFTFSSTVNDVLMFNDKLVALYDGGLSMYHVSSMERLIIVKEEKRCTNMATDGSYIYSACEDSWIRVLDLNNLQVVFLLFGHVGDVLSICFDENNIMYSTGFDGTIKRWNMTDQSVSYSFTDSRRRVSSIAIDNGVLFSGLNIGAIESYDTSGTLIRAQSNTHSKKVSSLRVLNNKLYSAGLDGLVIESSFNEISQNRILYQNTSNPVNDFTISGSNLVFISRHFRILALSLNSNKRAFLFATSVDPLVCIAATESIVFAGSTFGTIHAWSFSSGTLLYELTGHSFAVNDLLVVDSLLYSASDDGTIREWSIESGQSLRSFERKPLSSLGHVGPVRSLAVCNGDLFSGGADATTRKWNRISASHEDVYFGPSKAVTSICCNNFTLFSGSDDFAVYMYRFAFNSTSANSYSSRSRIRQETKNIPILSNDLNNAANSSILFIVIGFSVLLVLAFLFFFRSKIWRPKHARAAVGKEESTKDTSATVTDLNTIVNTSIGISKHAALELPSETIAVSKKLTSGGGGEVFIAKLMNPLLAKKHGDIVIQKKVFLRNKAQEEAFFQEVGVMVMLSTFPHFCQIVGYTLNPLAMILKYYPDGSLSGWIKKKSFGLSTVVIISSEIAQGLNTMHSHFLAHCDIKPQNILIETKDPKPSCYITDFGITQVLSQKALASKMFNVINVRGLSVHYAAPEAIRRFRSKDYSRVDFKRFDVYSFGVVLYEVLTKTRPWS